MNSHVSSPKARCLCSGLSAGCKLDLFSDLDQFLLQPACLMFLSCELSPIQCALPCKGSAYKCGGLPLPCRKLAILSNESLPMLNAINHDVLSHFAGSHEAAASQSLPESSRTDGSSTASSHMPSAAGSTIQPPASTSNPLHNSLQRR